MSRNHLYLGLFFFLRIKGNKFVRVHLLKEKYVLHNFFFNWLSQVKLNIMGENRIDIPVTGFLLL